MAAMALVAGLSIAFDLSPTASAFLSRVGSGLSLVIQCSIAKLDLSGRAAASQLSKNVS